MSIIDNVRRKRDVKQKKRAELIALASLIVAIIQLVIQICQLA